MGALYLESFGNAALEGQWQSHTYAMQQPRTLQ